MTLVLSAAKPAFALQVSDRLVTKPDSLNPADPAANKAILFLASNALISMAYSGLAVVHFRRGETERATDHWLVEQLTGQPIEQCLTLGGQEYRYDLGYALNQVCQALNADSSFRSNPIEVDGCGFTWNRSARWRSVSCKIRRRDGKFRFGIEVNRAGARLRQHLSAIPSSISIDGQAIVDRLAEIGGDADTAETLLVNELRKAAKTSENKVIGTDCMSVLIGDEVRVRYHGSQPTVGTDAMTPWIVTPGVVSAPDSSGSPGVTVGGLTVSVDVPTADLPFTEPSPGRRVYILRGYSAAKRPFGPSRDIPPPPVGIDGPRVEISKPTTGRNQPCVCGSGKKFKKCCGA